MAWETSRLRLAEAGKLIYLGRSNGVAIFYDVKNKRTLRLPDSQIVITRKL